MIIDCAVYSKGVRQPGQLDLNDALEAGRSSDHSFAWIGLYEPEEEEFDAVAREFHLHPLAVEDAVHAHQRPKLEHYGDCLFLVLRTARYNDEDEAVEFSEILLFAGDRFIVTVRHGEGSALAPVREQLESDPGRLALGPIAVVHAIVDRVVDDYQPVLDGLDNDIAEIEAEVFSPERTNPAVRIYKLKRQVLALYRAIQPLAEPLANLKDGKHSFGEVDLGHYFRDVDDHVRKAEARIEIQRELLSEVLDVNLTHVSVHQNEDMRTIAGWAAMAAVPTMLAGIWGMNFRHMPELDQWWGYPMALGLMAVGLVVLYRTLHRRGWI
ncbi:MAG TPA: magnesium and cobalt transport protein CorA [Acidimicrobiales bacterium]|nr:magnesium and cobalt transport protein CorA [Acidimicrobiales bacterium]